MDEIDTLEEIHDLVTDIQAIGEMLTIAESVPTKKTLDKLAMMIVNKSSQAADNIMFLTDKIIKKDDKLPGDYIDEMCGVKCMPLNEKGKKDE